MNSDQPSVSHRNVVFEADGEKLAGTFISGIDNRKDRILFLHGAGQAVRSRIFYLADHLATLGHDSFCFDFSGHGESSGAMAASSLKRRDDQASAAWNFAGEPRPKIIFGNSMGGYVAAGFADNPEIHTLVLICPALYATEAYPVKFDETFTAIIRKPRSFENAHIREKLRTFKGRVLLLIGAEDTVIPSEVMTIYRESFPLAEECKSVVIPEATHQIHLWAQEKPDHSKKIFSAIDEFLS